MYVCFMLQMLCEERGFFLEIADIIRSFGLNILKGVMEVRENKIWARFIVEVNIEKIYRRKLETKYYLCFQFFHFFIFSARDLISSTILQANRHVTRMDIFLSLVQLLQETAATGVSPTNQSSNDIDTRVPPFNNYQQPSVPPPISLAETLR